VKLEWEAMYNMIELIKVVYCCFVFYDWPSREKYWCKSWSIGYSERNCSRFIFIVISDW
jgi:hypothetical protein